MQTLTFDNVTFTNITIENGTATFQGSCPATPELEKAVQPKFSMWKPKHGQTYHTILGDGQPFLETWVEGATADNANYWAGNCYPTRELAECKARILQLTSYLDQACVAMGGVLGAPDGVAYFTVYLGGGYSFADNLACLNFENTYEPELTELSELQAKLTAMWKPYLTGGSNA